MKHNVISYLLVGFCMVIHHNLSCLHMRSTQYSRASTSSSANSLVQLTIVEKEERQAEYIDADTPYIAARKHILQENLQRLMRKQKLIEITHAKAQKKYQQKEHYQHYTQTHTMHYEYSNPQNKRNELINETITKTKIRKNTLYRSAFYSLGTIAMIIMLPLIMVENGKFLSLNFSELLQQWNILFLVPFFYGIYKVPKNMYTNCRKMQLLTNDIKNIDHEINECNKYLFGNPQGNLYLCQSVVDIENDRSASSSAASSQSGSPFIIPAEPTKKDDASSPELKLD